MLRNVSSGLSDGLVSVYDSRLPEKSQRTMTSRELEEPVVGLSLFSNASGESSEGDLKLIAGARNGEVRLWEPRMFKVSVVYVLFMLSSFVILITALDKCQRPCCRRGKVSEEEGWFLHLLLC